MKISKAGLVFRPIFFLLTLVALAGTTRASVRVGAYSLSANGQIAQGFQYTGSCPVHLQFDWGVIGTEPARATYTFLRSDGGHLTSPRTMELPPNRSVSVRDEWSLGANTLEFRDYHGWVQLNIESPNRFSQRINFTIHCGAGAQQPVQQAPPTPQSAQSPIISTISPPAGSASQTVTISGSGFNHVNRVMFNSRIAPIKSKSDTQLVVTAPATPNVPSFGLSVDVTLCTPAGCTRLGKFKYQP
jgi:hypothetical protein